MSEHKWQFNPPSEILWSFALAKPTVGGPDGLEFIQHKGPMPPERIRELIGGDYELMPLQDRTCLAVRKDQAELAPSPHYQGLAGPILVGKMYDGEFVGLVGIK